MADPKLPRGAVPLAADAILAAQNASDDAPERNEANLLATVALTAALAVIQRDAVRQAARRILLLDEEPSPKMGPYYDMRTSLRRLSRGDPLPDWPPKEGGDG